MEAICTSCPRRASAAATAAACRSVPPPVRDRITFRSLTPSPLDGAADDESFTRGLDVAEPGFREPRAYGRGGLRVVVRRRQHVERVERGPFAMLFPRQGAHAVVRHDREEI